MQKPSYSVPSVESEAVFLLGQARRQRSLWRRRCLFLQRFVYILLVCCVTLLFAVMKLLGL